MTISRELGAVGVITGRLDVYHRTGDFIVGAIKESDAEALRVIGVVLPADERREVMVTGVMEQDKRRGGLVCRIRGVVDQDVSLAAFGTYLGSGLVFGLGPERAAAVIATFGAATFAVVAEDPARLTEISGLSEAMLPRIRDSLSRTLHLAAAAGLLLPFGVRQPTIEAAVKRWGTEAASLISASPYRLTELPFCDFPTADAVGLGLGRALDAPERLEAALTYVVESAVREEGHTVVPRALAVSRARSLLGVAEPAVAAALARVEARGELSAVTEPAGVAPRSLARAEALLAETLAGLMAVPPDPDLAVTEAEIAILEDHGGLTFDATQRATLMGVLNRGLTVLTGGPGTGKTTLIRAIADLAESRKLSVALMSFTGKAAKRMTETTGREATTIHRYLRYVPPAEFQGPAEPADVIIVDEVSMLDVRLAAELAAFISPSDRLVLVGDVDQLPAIGPGNVLADLIAAPDVPVFRLSIIHRTEEASMIPTLARAINNGDTRLPYDRRTTLFVDRPSAAGVADWIEAMLASRRDRLDDFWILAPMYDGLAGVHNLNRVIANLAHRGNGGGPGIESNGYSMQAGDRILWLTNDRDTGLFNGEIGTLVEVWRNGGATVAFNGRTHRLAPDKVAGGAFTLAYAMTVHKAQGGQMPIVISVVDRSASRMLSRRLLYTAVSRAIDTAVIVGNSGAVAEAVATTDDDHRLTALTPLLRQGRQAA